MRCEKLVLSGMFARSPLVMGSTIPPRGDKLSKPLTSLMKLMRIIKVGNIKQILSLTHPNCLTSRPRTMHDSGPINPLFLHNLYIATLVKGSLQMLHRTHWTPAWMGGGLTDLGGGWQSACGWQGSVRSDVVGGEGLVGDGGTMDGEETVGCNTLGSADGE